MIKKYHTPLGVMLATASARGITFLGFVGETPTHPIVRATEGNYYLESLALELDQYFSGVRRVFTIPLDIQGSELQKRAWSVLREIEYGRTISYGDQARKMDTPVAARDVGQLNKQNRIAILIPCHRAIGADGSLIGYGGGLWRKRKLLALEGVFSEDLFQ